MSLIANDLLTEISLALIDDFVYTTASAPIGTGVQTVTPLSMTGIYIGALLIVGAGTTREIVTVTAVTATTFTATFVNTHPLGELIQAATFAAGLPDYQLFTQAEMLSYMAVIQNDFLVKTRPVYVVGSASIQTSKTVYDYPSDAIRIERIDIAGTKLRNVSTPSLDWANLSWQQSAAAQPDSWYTDKTGAKKYAVTPSPNVGYTATLMYSQSGPDTIALTDTLLVPDPMAHYIKYGMMAVIFGKDGEQRDVDRAQYCGYRYDLGVKIVQVFMEGVVAAEIASETREMLA